MNSVPKELIAPIEGQLSLQGSIALRIEGQDATDFLHGQFTCDVKALEVLHACPGSWCSPKGRVLFYFLLLKVAANDYRLFLPEAEGEAFCKRLQMYILRAQVQITSLTEQVMMGTVGKAACTAVAGSHWPEQDFDALQQGDSLLIRLPGPTPRLLSLGASIPDHSGLAGVSVDEWRALDMLAGLPAWSSELTDDYLPQMLNLDLSGGLSFTKGCYPGQEIVIRVRHRGRLKQRMVLMSSPVPFGHRGSICTPVDDKVGEITNTALLGDGSMLIQGILQLASLQSENQEFRTHAGEPLQLLPMPYQPRLFEGSGED